MIYRERIFPMHQTYFRFGKRLIETSKTQSPRVNRVRNGMLRLQVTYLHDWFLSFYFNYAGNRTESLICSLYLYRYIFNRQISIGIRIGSKTHSRMPGKQK